MQTSKFSFKLSISYLLMTSKCKEPCHQQLGCWIIYTEIFQPQQQKINCRNESWNVYAYLIIKNIYWRIDSKEACLVITECVEDCIWQPAAPSVIIRHTSWWPPFDESCTIVSHIIQVVGHTFCHIPSGHSLIWPTTFPPGCSIDYGYLGDNLGHSQT